MKLSLVLLFSILALRVGASAPPLSQILADKDHCVAYKASKRLFLVRSVQVVGQNCEVSSQILPELGGRYLVEVLIPISRFESGEAERDRDVVKLLGRAGRTEVIFRSESMDQETWKKRLSEGVFEVQGKLQIGEQFYDVKAQAQIHQGPGGPEVEGVIKARFQDFELKPPAMGMGLMAKVGRDLELHFRLSGRRTLGLGSLL